METQITSSTLTTKRILIISRTITEAERLANAVQSQVQVVWYTPQDSLASLQRRIHELTAGSKVSSIGLAEHGSTGFGSTALWQGLESINQRSSYILAMVR